MIITVMGRIPADITVGLGKVAVTFAVSNAILFAFTDTLFPFPVGSYNTSSITGQC